MNRRIHPRDGGGGDVALDVVGGGEDVATGALGGHGAQQALDGSVNRGGVV